MGVGFIGAISDALTRARMVQCQRYIQARNAKTAAFAVRFRAGQKQLKLLK
jgi:hypothetical protein